MPGVLFAGIDDWMAIIVPVASIVIYLLNQIFDKSGQQNQQPRRQQQFERQIEPTPEDDEVARMVREATQRSRERAERARRPEPARRQEPARKPEPARADWRTRSSEVVEAEVVEDRGGAPRKPSAAAPAPARNTPARSGVAAHVEKYLGEHERQFNQSVEATVNSDDVKSHLEEQVHAKFDHQVGSMDAGLAGGASSRVPVEDANPGRAMLMSLFSQPQNFRQAFILQEVLDPPPIY